MLMSNGSGLRHRASPRPRAGEIATRSDRLMLRIWCSLIDGHGPTWTYQLIDLSVYCTGRAADMSRRTRPTLPAPDLLTAPRLALAFYLEIGPAFGFQRLTHSSRPAPRTTAYASCNRSMIGASTCADVLIWMKVAIFDLDTRTTFTPHLGGLRRATEGRGHRPKVPLRRRRSSRTTTGT